MHAQVIGARKACDDESTQGIVYPGNVVASFDVDRLNRSEFWSAPLSKGLFVPSPIDLARTMATISGDIAKLIREIIIAGHTPCEIDSQDKFILEEANKDLMRIARETIIEAEQVARTLDNDSSLSRDVAALSSLRRSTVEFEVVIQSMEDASAAHTIARFFSLSGQNQMVQKLLSHFKDEPKNIVRDILTRKPSISRRKLRRGRACTKGARIRSERREYRQHL